MLVIHDMRARLRGNDSRIIGLIADFNNLRDALWDEAQQGDLDTIVAYLEMAQERLNNSLIPSVPAYEPPTLHHEDHEE